MKADLWPHSVCQRKSKAGQRGSSLVVVVMLLIVIMLLSMSATQIILQSEKLARNEHDHLIAFHAAEAGLRDAERSLNTGDCIDAGVPPCIFGLRTDLPEKCPLRAGASPLWVTIDLTEEAAHECLSLYGRFTGEYYPVGNGLFSIKPPRFVIEAIPTEASSGQDVEYSKLYRITAMGFGMREASQAVLQIYYRNPGPDENKGGRIPDRSDRILTRRVSESLPTGRLSWREIPNWRELHEAAIPEY